MEAQYFCLWDKVEHKLTRRIFKKDVTPTNFSVLLVAQREGFNKKGQVEQVTRTIN